MGEDMGQATALPSPFLTPSSASRRQYNRLTSASIPQEAFISRRMAVRDQSCRSRWRYQINDGLDLLRIEVLMQRPERRMTSPAWSEALGTVQEQRLLNAFQDVVHQQLDHLILEVADPQGAGRLGYALLGHQDLAHRAWAVGHPFHPRHQVGPIVF